MLSQHLIIPLIQLPEGTVAWLRHLFDPLTYLNCVARFILVVQVFYKSDYAISTREAVVGCQQDV